MLLFYTMLIKDVFISYGRRESLGFASKLYQKLVADGYSAWFDQVNIPAGDDYQKRIDNGIESAHIFLFVIAPRSVESVNCAKEVELAIQLGKRIIPILHIQPESSSWAKMREEARKAIRKRDWVSMREQLGSLDDLRAWADAQEWANLQDNYLLKQWQYFTGFPSLDSFESAFIELKSLIEKNKDYTSYHTHLLLQALYWQSQNYSTRLFLTGQERQKAVEWLKTEFRAPEQAPCEPTALMADFICESTQNANNQQADVYFCHADNEHLVLPIKNYLHRLAYTTWDYTSDLVPGINIDLGIKKGIANADNFIFLMTESTLSSASNLKELEYAVALGKRVVPLLLNNLAETDSPEIIKRLRPINFKSYAANRDLADSEALKDLLRAPMSELIRQIEHDKAHVQAYTLYLCHALRWEQQNKALSMLLRGYALQQAISWRDLALKKAHQQPTDLHKTFLAACEQHKDEVGTDVFLSHLHADNEFAQKFSAELQMLGHTVWQDRPYLPKDAEMAQSEVLKGIDNALNFCVICSQDTSQSAQILAEIEHAMKVGKKCFVGIIGSAEVQKPAVLAEATHIDFRQKTLHEGTAELLASLREVDKHHLQLHQRWQLKAQEWEKALAKKQLLLQQKETIKEAIRLKTTEFLLPDAQCIMAREWYEEAIAQQKIPIPTALQISYITASEKEVNHKREQRFKRAKRNQIFSMAVSIALVMSIIFGAWAIINRMKVENLRQKTIEAAELAQKQAEEAKKKEVEATDALARLELTMRKIKNLNQKLEEVEAEEVVRTQLDNMQNRTSDAQLKQLQQEQKLSKQRYDNLQVEYAKALQDYEKVMANLVVYNEQLDQLIVGLESDGFFDKKRKSDKISSEKAKIMLKDLQAKFEKLEKR